MSKIDTFINTASINDKLFLTEIATIENGIEVKIKIELYDKKNTLLGTHEDTTIVESEKIRYPKEEEKTFKICDITKKLPIEHKYITKMISFIDINHDDILEESESTTLNIKKQEMKFSQKGIDLLKSIEELHLKVYDDQTGKDIEEYNDENERGVTIGYGHLISEEEQTIYKEQVSITRTQADKLFLDDLQKFLKIVNETIKVNLLQQEYDALVILAFNIGTGVGSRNKGFKNSSVVKLINDPKDAESNYPTLDEAWKAFNKSQGQVNKGIINRREAELKIFKEGVYEKW